MEAASGFEPLHRGFADLSLNHLGTPPYSKMGLKVQVYYHISQDGDRPRFICRCRPLTASALAIGDHCTAAQIKHLAGDVSRFLRSEIQCRFGDFLRTADSSNRHPAGKLLQGPLAEISQNRRIH
jgi:hypothetical protein